MTTPDTRIPDGDQIPQPPARRPLWRRRWARVTGAILTGFIGLIVIAGVTSHPSTAEAKPAIPPASAAPAVPAPAASTPPAAAPVTPAAPPPASTPPPAAAPAAPAPDQVIARFSGTGSGSTGSFTVPADGNWHLSYEYTNGSLFAGQAENFIVSEYGTDGTPGDGISVNDLAIGTGVDKAVPVYSDTLAGQKAYFKVITDDASWSLAVVTGSS